MALSLFPALKAGSAMRLIGEASAVPQFTTDARQSLITKIWVRFFRRVSDVAARKTRPDFDARAVAPLFSAIGTAVALQSRL
ncbi:MAG: hypothetical protein JNL46_11640 [Sphingosinicella sp.]|nr:hypothetical protein [Sphingosinicella sp.]